MEYSFQIGTETCPVIYGETLASLIDRQQITEQHILVMTNQRYYDLFAEKIIGLFSAESKMDWYICTNSSYCNNLSELNGFIDFVSRFPQDEHYLLIGFGNEGVMELASFYQRTSPLSADLWLLPVSIRSLAKGLTGTSLLFKKEHQVVLSINNSPQLLLFDHTLTNEQTTGRMVDLLIFVVCGLLCDHEFLRSLYRNYDTETKLFRRPFNALLEKMLYYYQQDGQQLNQFGNLFEEAFYLVDNGHLLSSSMKRFLGILLHLMWSNELQPLNFHMKNFLIWFVRLGYPVVFPEQILTSDYVEACYQLARKQGKCSVLAEIGRVRENQQQPQVAELLAAVTKYQKYIEEIEGAN